MTCDFSGGACDGNGGSHPGAPPLEFQVTAPGLTTASFDVDDGNTPADFGADVIAGEQTGLVGATVTSTTPNQGLSAVPEPGSIILFGTILAGIVTTLRKGRSRSLQCFWHREHGVF